MISRTHLEWPCRGLLLLGFIIWHTEAATQTDDTSTSGTYNAGSAACDGRPLDCREATLASTRAHSPRNCYATVRRTSPDPNGIVFSELDLSQHNEAEYLGYFRNTSAIRTISEIQFHKEMHPQPLLTNSAIWGENSSAVLLADITTDSIFKYYLAGQHAQQIIAVDLNGTGTQRAVTRITSRRSDVGYIVESDPGLLLWMDERLHVEDNLPIKGLESPDAVTIESVITWAEAADSIMVLADTKRGNVWSYALISVPLTEPKNFTVLARYPNDSRTIQYARLGYPILATLETKTFILQAEGAATVAEVSSGVRPLAAFPIGYEEFPSTGLRIDESTVASVYRSLTNNKMAAALYSDDKRLFLLLREPYSGQTKWTLAWIDFDGNLIDTFSVPARAPHIMLAPYDNSWVVVEKGNRKNKNEQPVLSITRFELERRGHSRATTHFSFPPTNAMRSQAHETTPPIVR